MKELILAINPGSTSTKVAVFENQDAVLMVTIRHDPEELFGFDSISAQFPFRKKHVLETLRINKINIGELTAVVARGGALRPMSGGTYRVNELMLEDCRNGYSGQHAINLASLIADEIAKEKGLPCFIVDPPGMDEFPEIARISGLPNMPRKSKFHALNQKAVGRWAAKNLGMKYEEARLVIAHIGGGTSIGAHENGRVIDVNDCYDSEGPFTPERAGTLPVGAVVELCMSGDYTLDDIRKMLTGKGGMVAHLGTSDMREVVKRIEAGDEKARLIYEAMAYQVAKTIGSQSTVLRGRVDAIVLTGGITYDEHFVEMITGRVAWIAPVKVYPGEEEMKALAEGALRVLKGDEEAKEYIV